MTKEENLVHYHLISGHGHATTSSELDLHYYRPIPKAVLEPRKPRLTLRAYTNQILTHT